MATANKRRMARSHDPRQDVTEELRHIRDLVFVRDLLAARGATRDEIRECDAVIDDLRLHLASTARQAAALYAA